MTGAAGKIVWEREPGAYHLEAFATGTYPDPDKWQPVQQFTSLEEAQAFAEANLASVRVRVVERAT